MAIIIAAAARTPPPASKRARGVRAQSLRGAAQPQSAALREGAVGARWALFRRMRATVRSGVDLGPGVLERLPPFFISASHPGTSPAPPQASQSLHALAAAGRCAPGRNKV